MMKAVALVLALCLAIYVSAEPGPHGPGGHGHGHGGQGGGHEGGHGGGGAPHPHPGPSMFVCHNDLQRFCPDFHPTSPNQLFESECFKSHEQELQPGCKKLMEEFRANGGHLPVPPPNPPTQPPNHPPHPPVGGTTGGSTESAEKPTPLQEACAVDKYRFCSELKNPYDQASLYVILPTLMFFDKCLRRNTISGSRPPASSITSTISALLARPFTRSGSSADTSSLEYSSVVA